MTVVWIVLAAVGVVVVARAFRQDGVARVRRERRPGEGLRRVDRVFLVPDGMVAVRHAMETNEAQVALGLLTSSGIAAALKPASSQLGPHPGYPARTMDVLVDAARVAEADALLGKG